MKIIVKNQKGATLCVLDKPYIPNIGDTIRVNDVIYYHKVIDRIFEFEQDNEGIDFVYLIVT